MRTALIAIVGLLTACPAAETWEVQTKIDAGVLCFEGAADANANVFVDSQECLSSSCDRDPVTSCTATLDGTTITVTSSFEWERATGKNIACTDDCGFMGAGCEVGPLAAGTYTVQHGDSESVVTIPTTEACGNI